MILFIDFNILKYRRELIAFLISIYGLFLRWQYLNHRELWSDELFQLKHTVGSFKPIWQRLSYGDHTCFPGDYLLTYPFAQLFSDSKWGLAIPHITITILGFYFLYVLCHRYFKTMVGFFVAFMSVSLNQNLIFHAFEFRPYAVLPTLALANFYFCEILISQFNHLSCFKKSLIGSFIVMTVWFHLYGFLIVGCSLFYHLLKQSSQVGFLRVLNDFGLFLGTIFIIAMPLWLWYTAGDPYHNIGKWNTFVFLYIPNPMSDGIGFLKGIFGNLLGHKALYPLLIGMIVVFVMPVPERRTLFIFSLVLIVLPIGIILLGDLIKSYIFVQRQFVWVMPFFAFFLGWQWEILFEFISARFRLKT